MAQLILSAHQLEPFLARRAEGQTALISPDLGLTKVRVEIRPQGILFPSGQVVLWEAVEQIVDHSSVCFLAEEGDPDPQPIQAFSEYTGLFYGLMPTRRAPTLNVSGIPMHRIKDTTPDRDTLEKIRAIFPIRGPVLDTCTGLGYTAIEAARRAEVVTVELEPIVLDIARLNPWSRLLFDNPQIKQIVGDAYEEVGDLEEEYFGCIVHDPPTLHLAGELYSSDFYAQLSRVLRVGGRLFHYIGDLASVSGANTARGVTQRLREAGFTEVRPIPQAFGLVARKGPADLGRFHRRKEG
jgi:predicted methyltransferase